MFMRLIITREEAVDLSKRLIWDSQYNTSIR